jgi:acyl carrier protein
MNDSQAGLDQTTTLDDAIREVVAATFDLTEVSDLADASSRSLPEWDSLGHIDLILALEQRFGVVIDPGDIASMQSFARIREVLDGLLG